MLRRVLTLLLLPCLLISQSAALAHSHGGNQPAGHDLRPHVHVSLVAHVHDHQHGHSHHHGTHSHHHDWDDEVAPADADDQLASLHESAPGHDSDALYVSPDSVTTARERVVTAFDHGVWLLAVSAFVLDVEAFAAPPCPHPRTSADPGSAARPLYIRHLALLI